MPDTSGVYRPRNPHDSPYYQFVEDPPWRAPPKELEIDYSDSQIPAFEDDSWADSDYLPAP
jgi:hypothetical protein